VFVAPGNAGTADNGKISNSGKKGEKIEHCAKQSVIRVLEQKEN